MRTLRFLLQKEFRQIFRDRSILPMIFLMPTIQLLILPQAADFDVRSITLAVVDQDHSTYSRQLVSKVLATGYFHLTGMETSYQTALRYVEQDRADLILQIPAGFERKLVRENAQSLFVAIDAINGSKASIGGSYLTSIIGDFNNQVRFKWTGQMPSLLDIVYSHWYNPTKNYKNYMVPGILVLLLTLVGGFLSALNIVREKEIGTIEQINVTPIRKWEFILGKLIPFWVLGLVVFTLGLTIARFVYGIIPLGSIPLLYLFAGVYLIAILGFGLLISTYSQTQLQAMFVAFFFIMIFTLMSGLFTSTDSMPFWARVLSFLTPVTHFIEVVRMIVLKGSTFAEVRNQFGYLVLFAVFLNGWAILNYRKTS